MKIRNPKSEIRNKFKIRNSNFLRISCFGFCLFVVGCGSGTENQPDPISFSETKGDAGYIQLTVTDSKNLSVSKVAKIEKYKVVLDGEGLEPVEQTISADANGVLIEGLPVGTKRRIQVFALNSREQVLREGAAENINIEGGNVTEVVVALQAIPVFLNVADGDTLSNQRLHFLLLTDPNHSLVLEGERILTDVVTSNPQVQTGEKGEARFYPGVFPEGSHRFTVRDSATSKSSSVTLYLWDGSQIKGAPLFAGSGISQRLGQTLSREGQSGFKGGEFFPNIVEALWNTR